MKNKIKKVTLSTLIILSILLINITQTLTVKAAESWNFQYTGNIQTFTAPYSGKYKLEVWGGQGGSSATSGANGGYGYIEIALLKDEMLYIVVGGQGTTNGAGGYNGGGSSTNGGSGGGATHIATKSGLLNTLSNNKDSVIIVAGGGGGSYQSVLPNQTSWVSNYEGITYYQTDAYTLPGQGGGGQGNPAYPTSTNANCSVLKGTSTEGTISSGYAFGMGGNNMSGGGGGWYGGSGGAHAYLSGSGGSGYTMETEFNSEMRTGENMGAGKAKITYMGEIARTITINTQGSGTYNNQSGIITINTKVGEAIELENINCYSGYKFLGYLDETGNKINNNFIMGKENMKLNVSFYAPLTITKEQDSQNSIKITMSQNDDFNKYYKVYQSTDGQTWYDAALAIDSKNGLPERNKTYAPGVYTYVVPFTGDYKIRLYGAQGGNAVSVWGTGTGGKGAYTEGIINLTKGTILYINIGKQGANGTVSSAACASAGGGFASDIRINSSNISQRIMVAAGGGGGAAYVGTVMPGMPAGGLTSADSPYLVNCGSSCWSESAKGATQTRGGYHSWQNRHAGTSGTSRGSQSSPGSYGGGYGYWCGDAGGTCDNVGSGTGGSSYISGYSGCTIFNGYTFNNTVMIAGTRSGSGYGYIDLLSDTNEYNSYMDNIYFYDKNSPNAPSNGIVLSEDNQIKVTWQNNGDNGTRYFHKVESYNSDTNELINTSNILDDYLKTDVVGYYYYIDTNSTGAVTASHTFVSDTTAIIEKQNKETYFHVAAVDGEGNISETYNIKLPSSSNYTVKHYQMNLDGKTYTLKETEILSGPINAITTVPTKDYTGFTAPEKQNITVNEDGTSVVLYYYTRNKYTVTLNKDAGINTVNGNGEYYYGATVSISATVKNGYNWSKWTGTHSTTTNTYNFTMPASNVNDTANTTAITYNISYNLNGGTNNSSNPTSYTTENTISLLSPTRYAYDFVGWYTDENLTNKITSITPGLTGNLNLYAKWTIHKYTIYTYIDKGYGALSEDQKVEHGCNSSVYYYPANGYDVEYVRYGTSNSNLTNTPIDILKVFENVTNDYYFHVSYKITETKKSEITKTTYNWIDLKL